MSPRERSCHIKKNKKEARGINHVTVCVPNLAAAECLFTKILGFEGIWLTRDVGSEQSTMDTVVVQRGQVRITLIQGCDKVVRWTTS